MKTEEVGKDSSAASKAAAPVAPAPIEAQDPTEEEREQREAEFEEALRMRVVRSDMIGRDRHFRRYWWLQGVYTYPSAPGIPFQGAGILGGLCVRQLGMAAASLSSCTKVDTLHYTEIWCPPLDTTDTQEMIPITEQSQLQ